MTENDLKERKALRCQLTKEFEIKDLSKIKYFLVRNIYLPTNIRVGFVERDRETHL